MDRRRFISSALVGSGLGSGAVIGSTARPAFAAGRRQRWRIALAVSKTLPIWGPGVERFTQNVEKLTNGELKIHVYGAGELVPALGTFDAIKNGDIQMGHSASYYWQGKVPAAVFFTAIPFGMSTDCMNAWLSIGGGQELWDELMSPHGLKCLPCGNPGYQTTGWFKKEIKTAADLQGLKIRIAGIAGQVYAKAGASPVLLPGGELFTGLATGVVDAVEWVGPYLDYILGLHKAAEFYYSSSWHEPGSTLELMINKAAWEQLPREHQLAIEICAAETDRWMRIQFEAKNAEYLQKIRSEKKVELRELPIEVLTTLKGHAEEVISEIAASSPLATRIYQSHKRFQSQFEDYQNWSERSYYAATKDFCPTSTTATPAGNPNGIVQP